MKLTEKTAISDDIEVMKCKNDSTHRPIRWDGLWDKFYSNDGKRLVQWTCKQCSGTFAKEIPEEEAEILATTLKKEI